MAPLLSLSDDVLHYALLTFLILSAKDYVQLSTTCRYFNQFVKIYVWPTRRKKYDQIHKDDDVNEPDLRLFHSLHTPDCFIKNKSILTIPRSEPHFLFILNGTAAVTSRQLALLSKGEWAEIAQKIIYIFVQCRKDLYCKSLWKLICTCMYVNISFPNDIPAIFNPLVPEDGSVSTQRLLKIEGGRDAWWSPTTMNLTERFRTVKLQCANTFPMHYLEGISRVILEDCMWIKDISSLARAEIVILHRCNAIDDVSSLENVQSVSITECRNIKDMSPIASVPIVSINYCSGVQDYNAFTKRTESLSFSLSVPCACCLTSQIIPSPKSKRRKLTLCIRTICTHLPQRDITQCWNDQKDLYQQYETIEIYTLFCTKIVDLFCFRNIVDLRLEGVEHDIFSHERHLDVACLIFVKTLYIKWYYTVTGYRSLPAKRITLHNIWILDKREVPANIHIVDDPPDLTEYDDQW